MKLTTELDITPEEARRLLGLPEQSAMQKLQWTLPDPLEFTSFEEWNKTYNPWFIDISKSKD